MNYHKIDKCSISNGTGFRTVLWVSGCAHKCCGCQNPETWDSGSGQVFDNKAKEKLYKNLEHDYIFGVTFSGGDPLYQGNRKEIGNLAKDIKEKFPDKTIWLYTGYEWEEIKNLDMIKHGYIDVIVDGKFEKESRNVAIAFRGSSNQRIIDVQKSLKQNKVILYENE